jgi:DNA repair exonuclease SbcCD ATPase subunit
LEQAEQKLLVHGALVTHFGKDGIQPVLTQAVLVRIERLCALYFSRLHSEEKALALDPEKFSKSIQVNEWSTPVNLLSGGELRRLQLAAHMAFSLLMLEKSNVSIDLRIFDEPCAPLDEAGYRAFLDQIKTLYTTQKTLLISHSLLPVPHADHRIKISCRGMHRSHVV